MFGVTNICAVHGFSGKVNGFITMPVKSNVEIYVHLYRCVDTYITFLLVAQLIIAVVVSQ